MLNDLMLNTLRQLARGLACQFGPNCEIVVHDLSGPTLENTIVIIENGHVSNRRLGDGPSQIVLETMKHDPSTLEDKLSYLTRTHDGRILKSSTLYIRNEQGDVNAVFAINYDITALIALEGAIHPLISTAVQGTPPDEPANIPLNVNELLDELIMQSIKLVGKPVAMMTKEDKIMAIQYLNNSGAFLVTKSGDKISKQFGISKYTLYSYIDASKKE